MPFFITTAKHCAVITYRGYTLENHAINLELVTHVRRGQYKVYPDNDGIPSLQFFTNKDDYVEWKFNNVGDREAELDMVLSVRELTITRKG